MLAITDHDTMAGADEAMAAGKALGLWVIRGVELSAKDHHNFHILGCAMMSWRTFPGCGCLSKIPYTSSHARGHRFEFCSLRFIMGGKFGRVLFLKEYATYIKDSMVNELTALNRSTMLSIDVIPVPTDEAAREMLNGLTPRDQ